MRSCATHLRAFSQKMLTISVLDVSLKPSHYMNQCWPIISEALWHSFLDNFRENAHDNNITLLGVSLKTANVWLQLHLSEANESIHQLLVPTVVAYCRPCSDWSHPLVRRYPYWRRWWCCSADLFLVAHGSRYRSIRPAQTPWLKQGMKAWHLVAISVTTIQAPYHFC